MLVVPVKRRRLCAMILVASSSKSPLANATWERFVGLGVGLGLGFAVGLLLGIVDGFVDGLLLGCSEG